MEGVYNMKTKYSIYIILYTFLFVYCPPIMPIYLLHILTLHSAFLLVIHYKKEYPKYIIKTRILHLIVPLIIAMLYLLIVILINESSIMKLYQYILIIIEIPICVLYLCCYFVRHKYSIYDVINIVLIAGAIQGVIATLSFLVPPFKDVLINILTERIHSENASSDIILAMAEHRLNGFASNLTFTTPIVQSLLGIISLYLALNRNYKYILYMPIMLFSALINARSSFVVLIYGLILIILMSAINRKTIQKFMIIGTVIIIATAVLVEFTSNSSDAVFVWISVGFNEIISFMQGESTGYFQIVLDNFIIYPEGLAMIFGTGDIVFGLDIGMGSDIGYINDLWLGGLVFISIVYFTFIAYYFKAYRKADKLVKFIILLLITTFVTLNIKGIVVSNNEFTNISILLSAVFILNKNGNLLTSTKENI